MKQGEQKAKEILERKGIAFDETHQDDGSKHSLPDLKYLGEERYLEVTHTLHNNAIVTKINRFHRKSTAEQLEIMEKARNAYDRIHEGCYPNTKEGMAQYKRDLKLVKSHMGYDPTKWDFAEQFSEFDCDSPIIECSIDNILREVHEKSEKHKSGNTDLFIFVLDDEFRVMMDLLYSGPQNGCYTAFFNSILSLPFPVVYVCAWNWETQNYETENPLIMKFEKTDEGGLLAKRV